MYYSKTVVVGRKPHEIMHELTDREVWWFALGLSLPGWFTFIEDGNAKLLLVPVAFLVWAAYQRS